jgi:hypothetical protein
MIWDLKIIDPHPTYPVPRDHTFGTENFVTVGTRGRIAENRNRTESVRSLDCSPPQLCIRGTMVESAVTSRGAGRMSAPDICNC